MSQSNAAEQEVVASPECVRNLSIHFHILVYRVSPFTATTPLTSVAWLYTKMATHASTFLVPLPIMCLWCFYLACFLSSSIKVFSADKLTNIFISHVLYIYIYIIPVRFKEYRNLYFGSDCSPCQNICNPWIIAHKLIWPWILKKDDVSHNAPN